VASVNAVLKSEEASGPRISQCAPGQVATPWCAASDAAWAWAVPPQAWPLFVQESPDCGHHAGVTASPSAPAVTILSDAIATDQGVAVSCAFDKRSESSLQSLLMAVCSSEDDGAALCGRATISFHGDITVEAPFELCGPATVSADMMIRVRDAVVDPDENGLGDLLHARMTWAILRDHPWSTPDTVRDGRLDLIVPSGLAFVQPGTMDTVPLDAGAYRLVLTLKAGASADDSAPEERVGKLPCRPDDLWASESAEASLRIRPFDLDGTGEIDPGDLALAMLDFGPCPGCSADLDGSGEVDQGDLSLILLNFGPATCR
jgi:hypothetical protein